MSTHNKGVICKGIKKDGTACKAQALKGKENCFNHDPDKPDKPEPQRGRPLSKEDIEGLIATIEGKTVLPDFQLEKIADIFLSKLSKAISLYMRKKQGENR